MSIYLLEQQKKWELLRASYERCKQCMSDAPYGEICCKHHCGTYSFCNDCNAECRHGVLLCSPKSNN